MSDFNPETVTTPNDPATPPGYAPIGEFQPGAVVLIGEYQTPYRVECRDPQRFRTTVQRVQYNERTARWERVPGSGSFAVGHKTPARRVYVEPLSTPPAELDSELVAAFPVGSVVSLSSLRGVPYRVETKNNRGRVVTLAVVIRSPLGNWSRTAAEPVTIPETTRVRLIANAD